MKPEEKPKQRNTDPHNATVNGGHHFQTDVLMADFLFEQNMMLAFEQLELCTSCLISAREAAFRQWKTGLDLHLKQALACTKSLTVSLEGAQEQLVRLASNDHKSEVLYPKKAD